MKLIKSSYEICPQEKGLEGIYKQIEKAGRTCYKSEDRITETSAKEFVDRMIKSGHGAMLEHGTVYLHFKYNSPINDINYLEYTKIEIFYRNNPYSKVVNRTEDHFNHDVYITSNYRTLIENNRLNDLQYLCEPTEYHEKRVTVKFILPISISRQFIRHRKASFAEQSTRYCNFFREKFGSELTFIKPYWLNTDNQERFENWCKQAEDDYMEAINSGLKAQEARELLPLCTKTELVMTAFVSDWEHLFRLRTSFIAETGRPHPDMCNLCDPLYKEFVNRGLMESLI